MASSLTREENLRRLKTRELIVQNNDGTYPAANAVGVIGDGAGTVKWTTDLALKTVTINGTTGSGELTYDSSRNALLLNGVPVGNSISSKVVYTTPQNVVFTFPSDGTYNVEYVLVGGGGGGGRGATMSLFPGGGGGGGGGGANTLRGYFIAPAGTIATCSIGAGGGANSNGASTSFSLVAPNIGKFNEQNAVGGSAGSDGTTATAGNGGSGAYGGGGGGYDNVSVTGLGGAGTIAPGVNGSISGGGSGGGSFTPNNGGTNNTWGGGGGGGGDGGGRGGNAPSANGGNGAIFGAGGGGGAAGANPAGGGNGGSGKNGALMFIYTLMT